MYIRFDLMSVEINSFVTLSIVHHTVPNSLTHPTACTQTQSEDRGISKALFDCLLFNSS